SIPSSFRLPNAEIGLELTSVAGVSRIGFVLGPRLVTAILSSLRVEACHQKHRNKHQRRSCQRKVCGFRYEIRKYIVSCHDLLLPIHPFDNGGTYSYMGLWERI